LQGPRLSLACFESLCLKEVTLSPGPSGWRAAAASCRLGRAGSRPSRRPWSTDASPRASKVLSMGGWLETSAPLVFVTAPLAAEAPWRGVPARIRVADSRSGADEIGMFRPSDARPRRFAGPPCTVGPLTGEGARVATGHNEEATP